MKVNYQLKLEEIINKEKGNIPKLLLHTCCAPCSSYVLEYLSNYFEITILYYNPNISPEEEYYKRLNEQKRLINELKLTNPVYLLECNYDNNKFEELSQGLEEEPERGARCLKCYRLRLEETARIAKLNDFDYFGTSLSVSPYKSSDVLNKIGEELSDIYGISYLYSDFKKKEGYKRSIELSKIYNLYRQDYCGCKYSKKKDITD
ncbi:MAG: epoxyqueuosine reductase QueH [Firmicutes bacterium]|nr:epoxyqueuosine reductase QueH [Bacillota bacterium]